MIIEKLIDEEGLSESEKQIARFILNKDNNIADLTSTELGKKSFSSQSTVIRLYKNLGIKTYREFISRLVIERNEFFKSHDLSVQDPNQCFSSYEDIQSTISNLYTKIMIKINLGIEKNTITRVCNRIMNAKSIDIFGTGMSDTLTKQLGFKLHTLGITVTDYNGLNYLYLQNITDTSKITIIISLIKSDDVILKIAKAIKEKNLYMVAICNKNDSALIDLANDCLTFEDNEFEPLNVMTTFFAVEYIENLIFSLLVSRYQVDISLPKSVF